MTVPSRSFGATLKAYVALTKPRIIELLLITTVPAMVLAAGGWPGWGLVLGTVGGGALSAGGANAINNVVDRDIDARMGRTRRRPLPAHTASPREALVLGLVLGLAGYLVLWQTSNAAAAVLATSALGRFVTRLALVSRTEEGRLEARVLTGETGEPVPGATVTLYEANWSTGHQPLQKLVAAGVLEIQEDAAGGKGSHGEQGALHAETHGHHPPTSSHVRGDR